MDIFCKIINGEIPGKVCMETDDVLAIMDANPHTPGHVLVIPKKHYTSILDMDSEITGKINEVAKTLITKMESVYPDMTGLKVVVNYGDEQQVKHYHMHLLPVYEKGKKPSLSQDECLELLKK